MISRGSILGHKWKVPGKKAIKTEKFFKTLGLNGGGWHLASKLGAYKAFIRSRLSYGMTILQYSRQKIDLLDKVQRESLCNMLSMSRNSSAGTLRVITGLVEMKEREHILKVKFSCKSIEAENSQSIFFARVSRWV